MTGDELCDALLEAQIEYERAAAAAEHLALNGGPTEDKRQANGKRDRLEHQVKSYRTALAWKTVQAEREQQNPTDATMNRFRLASSRVSASISAQAHERRPS